MMPKNIALMCGKSQCLYNPESQEGETESRPRSDYGKNLNHKKINEKMRRNVFQRDLRY